MNEMLFGLSELEFIKIVSKKLFFKDLDFSSSELIVYFVSADYELAIGRESAGEILQSFIRVLKKAIHNKLQLDKSLTENLGLMENEYYHEAPYQKEKFVMEQSLDGSSRYWVGSKYEIWGFNGSKNPYINTWLYNDEQGNIIFEVTPIYKWAFFPDEPENPDFVTYEEFMQNYKPLIIRIIPRDVAIVWLDQAMKTFRNLFTSQELYEDICKKLNLENC